MRKFWKNEENHKDLGRCHRYPPKIYSDSDGSEYVNFPYTEDDDFCGEFKIKEDN